MRTTYLALESLSAIVILILLYANIFEGKQHTKKRTIYTVLLVFNGIVVITDAATWLSFDWAKMPGVLAALTTVTYVVPFFVQAIFSKYLYAHLSEKAEVSPKPFRLIFYFSLAMGLVSLVLCISGTMFQIKDGKWYPGALESFYYLLYVASLALFCVIILCNGKHLGLHDLIAALSFCLIPLISIIISLSALGINLAIAFMAIEMLFIHVMLQSEREGTLLYQSNNDELTGLLNRRAYEDDLLQYPGTPQEPNFVYASIDINGLKQVNDNLGHAAGDELIRGAAQCLKRTLGNYGRVYRTGGDEFVSIFFADEEKLNFLKEDLEAATENWSGRTVSSLSVSAGYVTKSEFPAETVAELSQIADKRMYEEKERYYAHKGVDRRGQNEAHKILCSLYTKILRINLTEDNFSIVNMDMAEQKKEMGYSNHISEWLEGFGRSGHVHPDDLENYLAKTNMDYLRGYFRRKKTSLTVLYRRKYGDGFKQVMMEIIPTKDYSDEDQSLFLYVKNVDI